MEKEITGLRNKGSRNPMYGKHHTEESKRKIREALLGRKLTEEIKEKISIATKGKNTWMLGRKLSDETKNKISESSIGRKLSKDTRLKMSIARKGIEYSVETRSRISKSRRGKCTKSEHWNWKGGNSFDVRKLIEYKDWKLAVFYRDNFICVRCGYAKGNILQVHHIKSFVDYPELRYNINNGITLCKKCHAKMHPELKNFILSKKVDQDSIIGKMTEGA